MAISSLRLFLLPLALALSFQPASAQDGSIVGTVGAVQDCISISDGFTFDQKKLKKLGWKKANMDGDFGGVVTPYHRSGAPILLVFYSSCMAKFAVSSDQREQVMSALIAELTRRFGMPPVESQASLIWKLPNVIVELTPGPSNGSNVTISVKSLALQANR